ncbi:LytTR family DNA-binding domain-containing protein [soil metagenome]
MISALLIDDEESSRIVLSNLLKDFFPEVSIVGEAENVEDAYLLVNKLGPQLVFLDIQMPKANGFSLLKKFETIPFEVIFVTSFDKFAINAIKFSALDYLLKPVEIADLKDAVNKAIQCIEQKKNKNTQIINLVNSFDSDFKEPKIAVHAGDKVKMLSIQHIVYIQAEGRYCNIVLDTNEVYVTAKYLKEFEDYLSARPSFIRISQSLMINVKYIKEYSKGDPFIIGMLDGKCFEVPRRKKPDILERLKAVIN